MGVELAAGKGSKVVIETTGMTNRKLDGILKLIADKFGEGELGSP